jgi:hypothetical protein
MKFISLIFILLLLFVCIDLSLTFHSIQNKQTQKYLITSKQQNSNSDRVKTDFIHSNPLLWLHKQWSNGYMFLVHVNSHKCLTANRDNNMIVYVTYCNAGYYQQWKYNSDKTIENRGNGYCLTNNEQENVFMDKCGRSGNTGYQTWIYNNKHYLL